MSAFSLPIVMSARVTRSVAVAALLGASMLAGPLSPACAASATATPLQLAQAAAAQTQPVASAAETKAETVEQRIASLHTDLQITSDEEANWNGVAKAMRDNASAMEKLVADKTAKTTQGMTAMDDLKTYEKFARAHVAGLKNLNASFEKLYDAMPASQKKVADQVFQNFGHHEGTASHS
jgi:periplasmic protein CpxP/Spy